jgi:predicted dehydrogenase
MQDRRKFISAGLLIVSPKTAFGSQANSQIQLGLIGAGSRGTWITDHFVEQTGARVAAIADAFQSQADKFRAKFKVEDKNVFLGRESHKALVASNVDAVVIETPTMYHPEHAAAAVKAGKHVYLAKPVAADVPGCKTILAAGEEAARKKLSYWVDFQTRARDAFKEAASRIHRGDIGEPAFGHIYYHAGRTPWHETPGMAKDDHELRNWLHYRRISGDIIVEQNIHVIDVANWYLNNHPLRAIGTGGQRARKNGDVWDHYIVTFWYPNEVKVDFSSCQFLKGYSDLCMRVYGSKGTADTHYNSYLKITGDNPWPGVEKDDTFKGGAIQNVKDFIASVREGKPINNAAESVRSNLTCILGRMAAYRQRVVTWEEMMQTTARYDGGPNG